MTNKRAARKSRYGNLLSKVAKTESKTTVLTPVSDEITPYGAKKFRTPYRQDEFSGLKGTAQPAVVLDIDGTLQSWGSSADKKVMEFAKRHYEKDHVLLVITARDHGTFGYESSFNWLMHNLPYPFVGPFARAVDDPRYASEFKRELAQGLEDAGIYQIVGAADDNAFVNKMWKAWAQDHFENPQDFDLLEVPAYSYTSWRYDLPSKGTSYGSGSYSHKDEHWRPEYTDEQGNTVRAHWERDDANPGHRWVPTKWQGNVSTPGHWEPLSDPKHRPAGTSRWEKTDEDPAPGHSVDIANDPRWAHYLASRYGVKGLNVVSESPNPTGAELDQEINEVIEAQLVVDYSLDRDELEAIVAHDYPGYAPAELESMTVPELRELAGITDADYRRQLEDQISERFGGRFYPAELDLATTEELEAVLRMDNAEAEEFFDSLWEELIEDKSATRQELEDEVYAAYDDLSRAQINKMEITELELLMEAADALRNRQDQTQPLDVSEVLKDDNPPTGVTQEEDVA